MWRAASGRAEDLAVLGTTNSETTLITGYNLWYRDAQGDKQSVHGGATSGNPGTYKAMIDLADFDKNGKLKGLDANTSFTPRSFNLMRVIEHEFFGHGEQRFGSSNYAENKRNLPWLNSKFATIPAISARTNYHPIEFANGGKLLYNGDKTVFKRGNEVNYKWLWERLPDPRAKKK